jgi:hypothetical protein
MALHDNDFSGNGPAISWPDAILSLPFPARQGKRRTRPSRKPGSIGVAENGCGVSVSRGLARNA